MATTSLSLFRNAPTPHPVRQAAASTLTLRSRSDGTTPPAMTARPAAAPVIDTLIAILDAPLRNGETNHAGYTRKEHELGNAFARFDVAQSRAMHARLSIPKPDDELAQKFMLLTSERRARLLNFLADVRRRLASVGPSPIVLRTGFR